eukprot:8896156-Ditylum_brightwellii.AAC.1
MDIKEVLALILKQLDHATKSLLTLEQKMSWYQMHSTIKGTAETIMFIEELKAKKKKWLDLSR